jgi:hypothetical protein
MKENTYSDPFEDELENSPDEDSQIEAIEKLEDPAEIANAMKLFNGEKTENENIEKPSGDETDKGINKPTTELDENKEKKIDDPSEKKENIAPPPPPIEDKGADKDGLISITDEYINKADPKDRVLLTSIRGEKLSPKMLDIHLNAQRTIGRKAEEVRQAKASLPDDSNKNAPLKQPGEVKQDKVATLNNPEILANIDKMVISKLQEQYPELGLPSDPTEFKRFLSNLHYDDTFLVDNIKEDKRKYETTYRQNLEKVIKYRDNYPTENRNVVEGDVKQILADGLETYGMDLKKLGYDFTLDENGANPIIDALMLDASGNPDPSVIQYGDKGTYIEGIPVMQPNGIYNKFFRTYGKQIVQRLRADAAKNGYETATTAKNEIVNSLSDGTIKGEQLSRKEILSEEDIEKLEDPEAIKRILENIEIKG